MECSICLELMTKEKSVVLNCTHSFHNNCIFTWKSQSDTCPVCRCIIKFCYKTLLQNYIQSYYSSVYHMDRDVSKLIYLTNGSSKTLNYIKKISIYYVVLKVIENGNNNIEFLNLFLDKLFKFINLLPFVIDDDDKYSEKLLYKIIKRVQKFKVINQSNHF
jgi:hypothetical protein